MEISDIDPSVDNEEVVRIITEHLKVEDTELKIRSLRVTASGTKLAILKMPITVAKNIHETPRIKIGWTVCRLRILPKLIRCFNCHGFGHMAGNAPPATLLRVCAENVDKWGTNLLSAMRHLAAFYVLRRGERVTLRCTLLDPLDARNTVRQWPRRP